MRLNPPEAPTVWLLRQALACVDAAGMAPTARQLSAALDTLTVSDVAA